MSNFLFESLRLRARPLIDADEPRLFAVYSDPLVIRYVDDGKAIPREDCERWTRKTHANYQKRGYGMSAIELVETGEVIGFCGLVHPGDQSEPEIKYAFHSKYWGQGFATECVSAMLAYGKREFGMPHIIATLYPKNAASARVLEKAGLSHARTLKNEDGSHTAVWEWRLESEAEA